MTKITITKDAMAKLEALTTTGGMTMSDDLLLRRLRIGWHDDDTPIWVSDAMTEATARIEQLTAERDRLALAICGGEDAPGYANAQTVETLEHVAKQNQQSHGATINSLFAAEAERDRLRAALTEWDALIEHQYSGSREAMSAMTSVAQRTAKLLKGKRNE